MKVDQKSRVDPELKKRFVGIGELLRSARIDNKWTQTDTAENCVLSRQTVSRIERGDPSVAWGQVGRLAQGLGVSHILGGNNPSMPGAGKRRVRHPVPSF